MRGSVTLAVQSKNNSSAGPGRCRGLLKEEHGVLFRDCCSRWLDTYVAVACKPSSARATVNLRNHLVPAFGAPTLCQR